MSKINEIKKLAGKTLAEKWDNTNIELEIGSKCSFCIDTIERNDLTNNVSCKICLVNPLLCSVLFETSLIEVISYHSRKMGYHIIDDLKHLNSYKLMVKCLNDLSVDGLISNDNLTDIVEMIRIYEENLEV